MITNSIFQDSWSEETLSINYSIVKMLRLGKKDKDYQTLIIDYVGEPKATRLWLKEETIKRIQKEFAEYMNGKGLTVTLEGNAEKYFEIDPYFTKPIPDTN